MGLTPSIGAGQFHSTIKTQTLQSTARSSFLLQFHGLLNRLNNIF